MEIEEVNFCRIEFSAQRFFLKIISFVLIVPYVPKNFSDGMLT
jgi:hypothetical protein